jgi:GNAT superfamily N-acetyltransferase
MRGISMFKSLPNTVQVLEETDHTPCTAEEAEKRREVYEKKLKDAKKHADFAEKEQREGFPLLHAHTLVGDWGALQSSIEDALVGMLMNEPELMQLESFSKIKITLAEFETLEKEERMRLLVEELQRGQGLGRKQGADVFEALLDQVKLSGPVEDKLKKTMWEMHNLRNVIVHRGSIADRRLVKGCPWLGLKVGDRVKIDHEDFEKHHFALGEYLMVIIRRMSVKYEVDIDKKIKDATESCENRRHLD